MKISFEEANEIIKEQVRYDENIVFWEFAEDSYKYPNGAVLIVYHDPNHEHEHYHVTYDLDNWEA